MRMNAQSSSSSSSESDGEHHKSKSNKCKLDVAVNGASTTPSGPYFYFRRPNWEEPLQAQASSISKTARNVQPATQTKRAPLPTVSNPRTSALMARMAKVGGFGSTAAMLDRSYHRLTRPGKLTITSTAPAESEDVPKFSSVYLKNSNKKGEDPGKFPSIFDFLPNPDSQHIATGEPEADGWVRRPLPRSVSNRRSRIKGEG